MRSTVVKQSLLLGSLYLVVNKTKPFDLTQRQSYRYPFAFFKLQTAFADSQEDRPYLGCSLRSMMDSPGMMVILVNTESPAWHGEMKVGDVLLEIEGRPIN